MQENLHVKKANQEVVLFQKHKLIYSLTAAGATEEQVEAVWDSIKNELYDGIKTKKIFQLAFRQLKKIKKGTAAKYKLKNAIRELGPSGYHFEQFISELLIRSGFKSKTNLYLQGKCVTHEVDIEFEKDNEINWAECKFFNKPGAKADIKVALYFYARFLDLKTGYRTSANREIHFKPWLFTNNRFTKDAMDYAKCMNIQTVSWDEPHQHCLKSLIENSGLYPLTCLTTLTKKEKEMLLKKQIVFCMQIDAEKMLEPLNLSEIRKKRVFEEIKSLR